MDCIDPRKENIMHSVKFLFDEVNREIWGIPQSETRPDRTHGATPRKRIGSTRFGRRS